MTVELLDESGDEPMDLSHRNEVMLVGRITGTLKKRVLPSGDVVATFRVTVDRGTRTQSGRKVKGHDAIDCAAWSPGLQKRMEKWVVGDVIELSGWLRRRFFRNGFGVTSRYEVEVRQSRRLGHAEKKPAKPGPKPKKQPDATDQHAA